MPKPTPPSDSRAAKKYFEEALRAHNEAFEFAKQAKVRALQTGWLLLQARLACAHGEWEPMIEQFSGQISRRTVFAYVQFVEDALVSVVATRKKLTDAEIREYELTDAERQNSKLFEGAREVVIHSSQGYVALAREFHLLRQFGQYDAVRHAAQKARNAKGGPAPQLEFNFTIATAGLRCLQVIDQVSDEELPPEKLDELETQLTSALEKVRARKKAVTINA